MLVKKSHVSLVLGAMLAVQMGTPTVAMAKTRVYFEQKLKEQELASHQVSLDPFDEEINAMLAEFGVVLQPVDPLWQNPTFVDLVLTIQKAVAADERGELAESILLAFQIMDLAAQIPNEDVQKAFSLSSMTPEEQEVIKRFRAIVEADVEAFKRDPEAVLEQWVWAEMEQAYDEYETYIQEHPVYAVYPYSDAWSTEPGRVVWLKLDTYGADNISAEWKQIGGTPVTWLNTNSKTDRAFLAPDVEVEEYLQFEVTYTDGVDTLTSTTYVLVYKPQPVEETVSVDPIVDLYLKVLGRNPDQAGYEYWTEQYASGMSLEEIENHFRASPEYQSKHM